MLIEIVAEKVSNGGIVLADHTPTPEETQERNHQPTPPAPLQGVVRRIGPWPKLDNGMAVLPDFGIGAKVVVRPGAGQDFSYDTQGKFKMVETRDVLAVLT